MSMRDVFWLCAGMLTSAALAFVLPAFVRALPASKPLRGTAIAVAIGVFALASLSTLPDSRQPRVARWKQQCHRPAPLPGHAGREQRFAGVGYCPPRCAPASERRLRC